MVLLLHGYSSHWPNGKSTRHNVYVKSSQQRCEIVVISSNPSQGCCASGRLKKLLKLSENKEVLMLGPPQWSQGNREGSQNPGRQARPGQCLPVVLQGVTICRECPPTGSDHLYGAKSKKLWPESRGRAQPKLEGHISRPG